MAAPSSTAAVAGPAPGPSSHNADVGVLSYLREILSGGAMVLQDAPLAVASEATGLMQEVPIVGIVCKAYLAVEQLVVTAKSNKDDLATLKELCDGGIKEVLKNRKSRPGFLEEKFGKLGKLVLKAEEVAELCNGDRCCDKMKRVVLARKISTDIAAVRSDILAFCAVITVGLADATLGVADDTHAKVTKMEAVLADKRSDEETLAVKGRELEEQRRVADLASSVKKPPGAPRIRDWYVVRKSRVAEACDLFGIGQSGEAPQEPRMVGLAGPSGAGKSTVAAMVIARDDVRAYFHRGVLWLQVGQEAKERLPELKSRLANMVYETVMQKGCRPPRDSADLEGDPEDGVDYIVNVMGESRVRFLVVADDVWDVEVLDALKSAGAWVLYTSRRDDLLPEFPRPLRLDQVLKEEAELVLRRAADLDDHAILPEAAYVLMERCEFAALDLAFVGRWSDVRGRSANDGQACWRAVLDRIVEEVQKGGEDGQPLSWRAAILRAGLDELACDNRKNKELYLSLAVIPKGLAFSPDVAAVLLYGDGFSPGDLEAAKGVMMTLERWSILTLEDGGKFRVHDEHADFIHGLGTTNLDTRDKALPRWREYMSSIRGLLAFSSDWLVAIWEVLAHAEGAGAIPRPYDAALDAMDPSDTDRVKALEIVAKFHWLRKDWTEAYDKNSRLLEIEDKNFGGSRPKVGCTLHNLAMCARKAGRKEEAEELYRRAFAIREETLGGSHPAVANTLHELGFCVHKAGRKEEAEELYRRALAIREDQLGVDVDHLGVADILYNLGGCARKAGRMEEAEKLYRRALAIREEILGVDHPKVAKTLYKLWKCVRKTGRTEEAEKLCRRALAIQVEKLGVGDPDVACTLDDLRVWLADAGRIEEADELYRQVLANQTNWSRQPGLDTHPHPPRGVRSQDGEDKEGQRGFRQKLSIREEHRALDTIGLQKPEGFGVVRTPSELESTDRNSQFIVI